jgi:hypothetical protein
MRPLRWPAHGGRRNSRRYSSDLIKRESSMGTEHGLVLKLNLRQDQPGCYSYAVTHHDQLLYEDMGFTSIAEALHSAVDDGEHVVGYEVAYGGYICGTYPRQSLQNASERIAHECVSTRAQFLP